MTQRSISIDRRGAVCTITINRPHVLNALDQDTVEGLCAAIIDINQQSDVRTVIMTGNGRAFCVGQDLNERRTAIEAGAELDLGESLEKRYNQIVVSIRNSNKVVIAAVNGVAAGAGANLALACDIVIASESAKFLQPFTSIGLVPDSGGTWVLPRLIGRARAQAICLLNKPISAQQAEDWGMIWKCVGEEEMPTYLQELYTVTNTLPPNAVAAFKTAIDNGASTTFESQLDYERDAQRRLGREVAYKEAVLRFSKKT